VGWGRWTVRLAAGLVIGGTLAGRIAPALAVSGPRQVLGTVSAQGDVRVRKEGGDGEAISRSGAALLEGTLITTGPRSAALLNLSSDGMIGLRANGAVEAGTRGVDGLRVTLWTGEALVRIPITSRMTLATATGTIRADELMPVAAGPIAAAEASVTLRADGETVVRVQSGSLRIEGADGGPTVVRAGEQATLAPDAAPRLVEAASVPPPVATAPAAAAPAIATAKAASAGIFSVDHDLAMLVGLGSAVVVGGTLGGLAGSGQFSDDDDHPDAHPASGQLGTGRRADVAQGSAFRAPR